MISTHSRSSQFRTARVRAPRQGFSLIEVAIALVIFVIGALAIIKIFPGALSVIGNNGDQQIATNLNRTTLTKAKSENAVPYATFNNSNADGTLNVTSWTGTNPSVNHSADFRDTNSSVIGVPRFNEALPDTQDIETGSSFSALSRYRTILGEKTKVIKLADATGDDNYVLTQFPISVTQTAPITPVAPVISFDYNLANVRIKPDGKFDFSRASDAADPTNTIISPTLFTPQSLLYVTYRYRNSSNKIWGVEQEAVVLPADTTTLPTDDVDFNAIKVNPPTTNPGAAVANGVVAEIVDVRLRKFLTTGDFGVSGASDFEKVADARRGVVRVSGLTPGTLVSVDYVADWSVLLKTGKPLITSATAPPAGVEYHQIALGTPFIEDKTEVGIYSLLVDPIDNKAYRSSYGESTSTTAADDAKKLVVPSEDDLRAGRVTFITPRSDSDVRVAYRTRDNWVQQLSVAASAYKPFVAGNAELWRDYYLGGSNYLYFHAGEAGKTISISYTVLDGTVERNFVDRPFVIESTQINSGSLVPTGFMQGFYGKPGDAARIAQVQLTNPAGGVLATSDLVSIQAIKGTSITARTAYINGTKYAQKIDTTTRGAN